MIARNHKRFFANAQNDDFSTSFWERSGTKNLRIEKQKIKYMKTLFQIKETSASSVRHCCRVLSLIAALTALSNGAWAQFYFWGTNSTDPKSDGSGMTVRAVQMTSSGTPPIYTYNISSFTSSDYTFFISTSESSDFTSAKGSELTVPNGKYSGYNMNRGNYSGKDFYDN